MNLNDKRATAEPAFAGTHTCFRDFIGVAFHLTAGTGHLSHGLGSGEAAALGGSGCVRWCLKSGPGPGSLRAGLSGCPKNRN
ncbi:MAG: hypothetical protein WAO83_18885 [Fuerstiella sp.]